VKVLARDIERLAEMDIHLLRKEVRPLVQYSVFRGGLRGRYQQLQPAILYRSNLIVHVQLWMGEQRMIVCKVSPNRENSVTQQGGRKTREKMGGRRACNAKQRTAIDVKKRRGEKKGGESLSVNPSPVENHLGETVDDPVFE
jgi:hypothetical protein